MKKIKFLAPLVFLASVPLGSAGVFRQNRQLTGEQIVRDVAGRNFDRASSDQDIVNGIAKEITDNNFTYSIEIETTTDTVSAAQTQAAILDQVVFLNGFNPEQASYLHFEFAGKLRVNFLESVTCRVTKGTA